MENTDAGFPQGSVLGLLLFPVHNNDLADNSSSEIRLFVDDSSHFTSVVGVEQTQEKLVIDLIAVSTCAKQWEMEFNPDVM